MSFENDKKSSVAISAINALYRAAREGDEEAMKSLVDIGNHLTELTSSLAWSPSGTPARSAADAVAEKAELWPVSIPAIEELREGPEGPWLPKVFGKGLGINVAAGTMGRPRDLQPTTRTGLAHMVWVEMNTHRQSWHELEVTSDQLEGLDKAVFDLSPLNIHCTHQWAEVGREWLAKNWPANWMSGNKKMLEAVSKRHGIGGTRASAERYVIFSELKKGLVSLSESA